MNNIKKNSSIVLFIFLFLIKIQDSNFVRKVENISYDAYQSFFIEKSTFEDVVIIDIDEKSIGEIGQFPWRRDIFADLIQKLNQYGVSVITFDVFFSEEDKQNPKDLLSQLQKETDELINVEVPNTNQIFIDSLAQSKVILPILGEPNDSYIKKNSKQKL